MSLDPILPSRGPQTPPKLARTGAAGGTAGAALASGSSVDAVRISEQGRRMSRLSQSMPPTPDNIDKLSRELAGKLKPLLPQGAITARNRLAIEVDTRTGEIAITDGLNAAPQASGAASATALTAPRTSRAPDARSIAALFSEHPDLARQFQDLATLSKHLAPMQQGTDSPQTAKAALAEQIAARIRAALGDDESASGAAGESHAFSRITEARPAPSPRMTRAIAHYAEHSGLSGLHETDATVCMVFDGKDVTVQSNGKVRWSMFA